MWIVWDPVEGVLGYILYLKIVAAGRKKRSYFDFWDLIENLEQNVMFGKKKLFSPAASQDLCSSISLIIRMNWQHAKLTRAVIFLLQIKKKKQY